MTRNDDIERVLQLWLAEGPRQMPDRLFDGTFERIDRLSRGRLAELQSRLPAVNLKVRLAAAAAVLIALVGTGLIMMNGLPSVGTQPSPAPTPTTSPTMLPSAVASAIQTKWTSVGDRPNFGILETRSSYAFTVDATTLAIGEFKGDVVSTWSPDPAGGILVSLQVPPGPDGVGWRQCNAGDEGRYLLDLSPDGATMSLILVRDPCPHRAGILPGDWTRWPCSNPVSICGTELAAGRHPAANFAPAAGLRLRYTVPEGWSSIVDTEFYLWLGRPNDPDTMGISVDRDVGAHSQARDCLDVPEPGIGTTPGELASWLATLPNVVSTTPIPMKIGDYAGMQLDVSVAPDSTDTCPQLSLGEGGGVALTAHSRYILLDLGPDHTMLIKVFGPDEARSSEIVAAALPVIESFEIGP
jgi:hypothetical protein